MLCPASCMMSDAYAYNRIDLQTYGRCAVTVSGSVILSHALKYYRHSELPCHDSALETTHVLCHASCMMSDAYAYNRIDLQTYGRCAVTLSGSVILSHALKYYRHSELPCHDSAPETTHMLCHVSCMMSDAYAYCCIDLQTYGRCAVTLNGSVILLRRPPTCYVLPRV
jgi:hypothetical protein